MSQSKRGESSADGQAERLAGAVDANWRWKLAAGLGAAFTIIFTVPWHPADTGPIGAFDFSWMLLLHEAMATGRQFGDGIILPQGPLGFIGTNVYDPRTYGVLIFVRIVIALVVFRVMWEGVRKFAANAIIAATAVVGVTALIGRSSDHFFPACSILLLYSYFVVHDRRASASVYAMTVVLGVASLVKVNQPFYAAVSIGTIVLEQMIRRDRRFFMLPVVYVVVAFLGYLSARQSLSRLGAFLWGWRQVTLGHADGVGLPGPWIDPAIYLVVVVGVLVLVGGQAWPRWKAASILPVAGTAGVLLLLYKHSFMRQDIAHVHMGPMVATATAILYTLALWRECGRAWRVTGAGVATVAAIAASSMLSSYTGQGLIPSVAKQFASNAGGLFAKLTDSGRPRREWEAARQTLRDENPLPVARIEGSVDVYPHRQDVVFAYGLPYAPRPVVSSLVATSAVLGDVNAKHLQQPGAATTILFDIELVDRNFPTMLDGASLPELLTRYDVIDPTGSMLLLRRAASPRRFSFVPLTTRMAKFDQSIDLRAMGDGPLWAHVRFNRKFAGKVMAMLYKPATLGITVHTRGGAEESYRLLPSLAEEQGFLLSPLLQDRMAYARLATTPADATPADEVSDVTIFVADESPETSFEPDFTIELSRLEFERQK